MRKKAQEPPLLATSTKPANKWCYSLELCRVWALKMVRLRTDIINKLLKFKVR